MGRNSNSGDPTPLVNSGNNNNDSTSPSCHSLPLMIHVTAPATLPAGYTFEAAINGDESKLVNVEVPEPGVEEGQVFLAELPPNFVGSRLVAPTGKWKDGLCDCCSLGVCHPSLWCSLCCTQIAMAQAISRMQLNWLGHVGTTYYNVQRAFLAIVLLVCSFFLYCAALEIAAIPYDVYGTPPALTILRFAGNLMFVAWSVYALCQTRKRVRERYQIPEGQHCGSCEDCCCAFWCSFCTTAQILRHTGEYESYPGVCCSTTGHPPGTPLVV